jgi:hypothetical protein
MLSLKLQVKKVKFEEMTNHISQGNVWKTLKCYLKNKKSSGLQGLNWC